MISFFEFVKCHKLYCKHLPPEHWTNNCMFCYCYKAHIIVIVIIICKRCCSYV